MQNGPLNRRDHDVQGGLMRFRCGWQEKLDKSFYCVKKLPAVYLTMGRMATAGVHRRERRRRTVGSIKSFLPDPHLPVVQAKSQQQQQQEQQEAAVAAEVMEVEDQDQISYSDGE